MFHMIATVPPSAQAGKEIIFEIGITNTGMGTWLAGEYSVLVKIYDANKSYLTETDKTRQFKDIASGEALSINITLDIPADYSGTYHYRVGIEFEEEELFSHYFILKVLPFTPVPEAKKWTGSIQTNYQDSQAIEPTASFSLRLMNLLPRGSYLRFSTSGRSTPSINPELSNFLVSYHSQKLDLSVGDFATGLSELTLSRSRGIKAGTRLGKIYLVGLVGSSQKAFKDNLYGLGGSVYVGSNLTMGANYVQDKNGQNSVASLQGELVLSPEITLSGEYAWSSCEESAVEQEIRKGNAFRIAASAYSEKLTLDASYGKVEPDFSFVGSQNTSEGYEEYDISLSLLASHIDGTICYNKYHSGLFQDSEVLITTTTTTGLDLTAAFPKLPLLLLSYSVDEIYISENGNSVINDTTNNFTVGLSHLIGKVRLSANYLRFSYKDISEMEINETITSINYGLSVPWGKRTTFSANYIISSIEDSVDTSTAHSPSTTLGMRYRLTIGKLVLSPQYKVTLAPWQEENRATASLGVSYSFASKSVFRLNYSLTSYGELINPGKVISDKFDIDLSYQYSLAKNHKLELNYFIDSRTSSTATESLTTTQNSSLQLAYKYHF
jgi:predicted porin